MLLAKVVTVQTIDTHNMSLNYSERSALFLIFNIIGLMNIKVCSSVYYCTHSDTYEYRRTQRLSACRKIVHNGEIHICKNVANLYKSK
jgi:hypothetical protein